MKTILLTTALLLGTIIHAQNWELFQPNETYNFNFDNIHGVRVDSVNLLGNETIYYFNRILNDTVHQNVMTAIQPITDITQPNIFGQQAISRNDSLIFTNQFSSLLYVKPFAPINHSWNFIQLGSERIEATVDSVYTDSINQVLDSVKQISFQYFDSLNNPINHSINAKKIIFSKANGVVSTFNLYEATIIQSLNSSYTKQYHQNFRSTVFTNREVFDLEVGDEYHFEYHRNTPNTPPGYEIYNHTVTSKSTSANGDTITLTIAEELEVKTGSVDYTTNPPTVTYQIGITNSNKIRKIIHPDSLYSKNLGFETQKVIDTAICSLRQKAFVTAFSYKLPYSSSTYNNRITIGSEQEVFYFDSLQNSWIIESYCISNTSHYALTGIFGFNNLWVSPSGSGGYYQYYSMLYFKKGTETWGTPRLVTRIEDQVVTEEQIYIYPNPAQHELFVQTGEQHLRKNYEIIDLKGRLVKFGVLTYNLNIEELEAGIYFLKLVQKKNIEILKFMKE